MWEILQEKVNKTFITDVDCGLIATPMTNGCHNDNMIDPSWPTAFAVSVRPDH